MDRKQIVRSSIEAILRSKLRSSLTIASVAIGVFSIVSVMTTLSVLAGSIKDGIVFLGVNAFQISKRPDFVLGGAEWRKYMKRPDITYKQIRKFMQYMEGYAKVCPVGRYQGETARYDKYETDDPVDIYGGNQYALEAYRYDIASGRNISIDDVDEARSVVLIGDDIRKELFSSVDPLGKKIRIKGYPFRVIGVLKPKGDGFGERQDYFVAMPFTSYIRKIDTRKKKSFAMSVIAPSSIVYKETVDMATGYFRLVRSLQPRDENDFEISTNDGLLQTLGKLESIITKASFLISFVSLIAAGIGIMNILLVSVAERTREIGLRKALGAKRQSILFQFFTEALILCLVGCALGIFMGVALGNITAVILSVGVAIPWGWVVISFLICTITGMVFGAYPAYKASRLSPIDALRRG